MKLLEAESNAELFRAKKLPASESRIGRKDKLTARSREPLALHRLMIDGMIKQWMRSFGCQQKLNRDKAA